MRELRDEEQCVSERAELRDEEGELACYKVKNIFISRVRGFKFFFFFFKYYICIRVGSGPGLHNTRTQPEPVSDFFIKTQTRPICFTDRVKPTSLGSGQTEYLRVEAIP